MPENNRSADWALEQYLSEDLNGNADTLCVVGVLMENCATDDRITWHHGYRFLDFEGVAAEFGARILYIKTGRVEPPFVSGKADWTDYLLQNGYFQSARNQQ